MSETQWKLDELAEQAGVSPRTVRYYVQRGLLPAPSFRGRDTTYGREHLVRLRAIRKLQEAFLPLDQIQAELGRRTEVEIEALADGRLTVSATTAPQTHQGPGRTADEPTVGTGRWHRWVLAPGLELHLADDADSEVGVLAQQLRELATQGGKKGRRTR